MMRSGVMLESIESPSASGRPGPTGPVVDRPLRRPESADVDAPAAASDATFRSRSRSNSSGVSSYIRRCRNRAPRPRGPPAGSVTNAGYRSATQPRTKQVARTPSESSRSSRSRVFGSTRLEAHSSSPRRAVRPSRRCGTIPRHPRQGIGPAGPPPALPPLIDRVRSAAFDELRNRADGSQDTIADLLIADRHWKMTLELEHQLECIDRVESKSLANSGTSSSISAGDSVKRRLLTITCLICSLSDQSWRTWPRTTTE